SIGRFDHLFPALDHHARIFERPPGEPAYPLDLRAGHLTSQRRRNGESLRGAGLKDSAAGLAGQRLAERYGPPAMVLNQDGTVLSAYGRVG
ncbi:hypothetical protein NYZ18_18775, partial [Acinetobacter baumannii]|nr:hypothetical protein [Acinetobacter baumannii]